MANKIFFYFCFAFCFQFVLQYETLQQWIDQIKIDNCIVICGTKYILTTDLHIEINCDGQTSFVDKKYSINDILKNIDRLSYATRITAMSISSNHITGFNVNYFCSINNYRFERLNMGSNKFNDSTKIGLGDINKCEDDQKTCENSIVKLNLSENPLKILKNNSFCHLKNLTELHLDNCSLNSIEADAFKFNNKITKLLLDENQLTKIPYLGHLSLLHELDISSNWITSIKNEDFFHCKKLKTLDLSENRIENIDDKAFDQISDLYNLFLSNNRLSQIFPAFAKPNILLINLGRNLLEVVNMLDFSKKLKYLDFRSNSITHVSANISNSQLTTIDFSNNKVKSIVDFELPSTIKTIYLSNNNIEYFSVKSSNEIKNLTYIFLDQNKIQILPNDGIKPNIYFLRSNPIACSCENSWLFNSKPFNKIYGEKCSITNNNRYNPKNHLTLDVLMLCESNFNNSNRCRIEHLKEPDFKCYFKCLNPCYCYTTAYFYMAYYYCSNSQLQSVPQWTNSGQLHEKSVVIVWLDGNNITKLTNVSFIDYYNVTQLYLNNSLIEEIYHFTFDNMAKLIMLDLSDNQLITIDENTFDKVIECAYRLMKNAGTPNETDGKVFDVFISYSNEDSNFVVTDILPKLENINEPYHVCVHERNFLGGGSIEDTIIEAIKKSTRIIVILTENYLQSDWCMYEFIIAHSVMIEDQCPRVVLIIKDDLPPDINSNLKIYLSTNTYIEWTDHRFWQRLYFALQSNKLSIKQTQQPMNFLMSTHFVMPSD
ncbi:TOLL-like receptor [Chamberlinius hualienensis]